MRLPAACDPVVVPVKVPGNTSSYKTGLFDCNLAGYGPAVTPK